MKARCWIQCLRELRYDWRVWGCSGGMNCEDHSSMIIKESWFRCAERKKAWEASIGAWMMSSTAGERKDKRVSQRERWQAHTYTPRSDRLTYAMIHRVISQRRCTQSGYDLKFPGPPVDGLDHNWKVVRQAFTPEQTLGL